MTLEDRVQELERLVQEILEGMEAKKCQEQMNNSYKKGKSK